MKVGYGYNVSAEALAHLGCDRVFIDTDRARPEREKMIAAKGVRAGDTLVLLYLRHLGGSPVADRVWREKVEALGVTIEVCPPEPGPVGRPKDTGKLPPEHEHAARSIWLGEGAEVTRLARVADLVGQPIGKGLLVGRFGVPSNPKPLS